jgi:hypothetical protein
MQTTTLYLLDSPGAAITCARTLIDAGVHPSAIGIHRWETSIAVRVLVAVPEPAATLLLPLAWRETTRASRVPLGPNGSET